MLRLADGGEGAERHRGDRDEHHDLLPLQRDAGERGDGGAHEDRHGGDLRRGGEERRHRRRRALVDVRRPHVERHRRDLEAEAGEQEHEAEDQPDAALPDGLGDAGERHGAGEAVDQRAAVEQHAGRQRAEHEILQAGFGRAHVVAVRRRDHVEREAHQFEAEIERDQIAGRDQHPHADASRAGSGSDIRTSAAAPGRMIVERHHDGEGRADIGQDLQEAGEVVDDEAAAEHSCRSGSQATITAAAISSTIEQHADERRRCARGRRRASAAPWRRPPARSPAGPASCDESGDGVHRPSLTSPARRISPRRAHAGSCRAAPSPRPPTCRAPASDRSRTGTSARSAARKSRSRASPCR